MWAEVAFLGRKPLHVAVHLSPQSRKLCGEVIPETPVETPGRKSLPRLGGRCFWCFRCFVEGIAGVSPHTYRAFCVAAPGLGFKEAQHMIDTSLRST